MAMGSAFDMFAKRYLGGALKINHLGKMQLANLYKQVEYPEGSAREQLMAGAQNLCTKWVELGLAKRLLDGGLYDLEVDLFHTTHSGIRLYGKLDAVTKQDLMVDCSQCQGTGVWQKNTCPTCMGEAKVKSARQIFAPLDFKVRGFNSSYSASPTPGYVTYVSADGKVFSAHDKRNCSMDQLHDDWAVQLCLYAWMLNPHTLPGWVDLPVAIEEFSYGTNTINFTQIRSYVSKAYQQELYGKLQEMWETLAKPRPTKYEKKKCEAYNRTCELAEYCEAYKKRNNSELSVMSRR